MLRLAGEPMAMGPCPTCKGTGRVKCPATYGNPSGPNAMKMQVSTGKPIPCPECKGKKVVAFGSGGGAGCGGGGSSCSSMG